jgi:hypothetical protein
VTDAGYKAVEFVPPQLLVYGTGSRLDDFGNECASTSNRAGQSTEGASDENHVAEALRLGRMLITCDRDYLDERRFPVVHCPALVVCDFGRGTVSEIWDTFKCFGAIFSAPQFFDKWTKIDARRDNWTEYARYLNGTSSRRRYRFKGIQMQEWVDEGPT